MNWNEKLARVLSNSIKDIAGIELVYLLAKPEEATFCSAVAVCEMLTVVTVKFCGLSNFDYISWLLKIISSVFVAMKVIWNYYQTFLYLENFTLITFNSLKNSCNQAVRSIRTGLLLS